MNVGECKNKNLDIVNKNKNIVGGLVKYFLNKDKNCCIPSIELGTGDAR